MIHQSNAANTLTRTYMIDSAHHSKCHASIAVSSDDTDRKLPFVPWITAKEEVTEYLRILWKLMPCYDVVLIGF